MDTFKDSKLQQDFSKNGYVIIPCVITAEDIAQIQDTYNRFEQEIVEPFHTSHFSKDIRYKEVVHDTVSTVVFRKMEPFLCEYKPVFGNFMVKHGNVDNFLQMHADWTYVDEPKFRSVSAWISLVDTNKANGCFGVIEGSQAFMNTVRGPGIQQNNFKRDRIWVKKYGKLLPVKAGDAIVFDHALLHFSPPNTTPQTRLALNLSMVPSAADVIHYCIPEGETQIEKYEVHNNDFFLQYDNWQRPQIGQPVAFLPKSTIQYIDDKVEHYGETNLTTWGRLVSFFKEHLS